MGWRSPFLTPWSRSAPPKPPVERKSTLDIWFQKKSLRGGGGAVGRGLGGPGNAPAPLPCGWWVWRAGERERKNRICKTTVSEELAANNGSSVRVPSYPNSWNSNFVACPYSDFCFWWHIDATNFVFVAYRHFQFKI